MKGLTSQFPDQLAQHRVTDGGESPRSAIDTISHEGMPRFGEMHPYLVGPAGFQSQLHEGYARISGQDLPVGDRVLSLSGSPRHSLAVHRMTADGRLDASLVVTRGPEDEGEVDPLDGMFTELTGESVVGSVVFGGNENSGSVLIDPMHDAGAQTPTNARKVAAVPEKCVDQRSSGCAGPRMNRHAGRLVYDDDVAVLMEDCQRDFFGNGLRFFWRWYVHADVLAPPQFQGRFLGSAVNGYHPGLNEPEGRRTRQSRH